MFPDFIRRTLCKFQTVVELAVAGFYQGLMQVALGKIPGQIVGGQGGRQGSRSFHRRHAIFLGWLGRTRAGAARRGRTAGKGDDKARG